MTSRFAYTVGPEVPRSSPSESGHLLPKSRALPGTMFLGGDFDSAYIEYVSLA